MFQKVEVKVPATTANLGPGFDCLGMALELFNTVTIERSAHFHMTVSGEGAQDLRRDESNIVYRAVELLFRETGASLPLVHIQLHNEIPLARGLGSSAAAIVGGLVAGNHLQGSPLTTEDLLQLAYHLEGHPDNVTPALFGGCTVAVLDGERVMWASLPLPAGLQAVLFIPHFAMDTQKAREVLPLQIPREGAIFNIGRVALLVTALTTGRLECLRIATQDALHQPWRQSLFPAMPRIFEVALGEGALGVFLSGAGSTIMAISMTDGEAIAQAMKRTAEENGVEGRTLLVQPSLKGATIVEGRS
ncbi:MAG: homoserine kinase [Chloroflexi bacterium]|nr:homoserine kinase [Chloroflexota bacterium]